MKIEFSCYDNTTYILQASILKPFLTIPPCIFPPLFPSIFRFKSVKCRSRSNVSLSCQLQFPLWLFAAIQYILILFL